MTKYHYYFLGVLALISLVAAMFAQPSAKVRWSEQAKLVYENKWNWFGHAIAIDGDTVVVGIPSYNVCPGEDCGRQGAANVYTRSGDTWVLQAQLLIPENLTGYEFGTSVAIDGDTIVVGTLNLSETSPIFVFTRSGDTWSMQAQLTPPISSIYISVAIDGDTAVATGTSQIYVFERNRSTNSWSSGTQLKIVDEDPSFSGNVVDIDGDTIIIGSGIRGTIFGAKTAYIFVRDPKTAQWEQQAVLKRRRGNFGSTVAISGNTVVLGGPVIDGYRGAALVYERNPSTGKWSQRAKLVPNDVPLGFYYGFGMSVAIDGDIIMVGCSWKALDFPMGLQWTQGATYGFVRNSRTGRWSRPVKLLPDNKEEVSYSYGQKVALSGKRAVVVLNRGYKTLYIFEQ